MSRGEVLTRPFIDVENTPHDGHAAAVSSAVTAYTTRVPSAKHSTRSTRTPGSPNNNVVPSITALGFLPPPECFATLRLQKAKGLQLQRHANESEITTARLNSKSLYRWAMRSSARRSDVWAWRLIAHCSGPCPGGSVSVPPRASCFGAPLSVPIPRWGSAW